MENEYTGHPYQGEPENRHEGETAPFVLSILSIVSPGLVGLVLSIIALVKVSKLKNRGQKSSMITASYTMSIIGIVLSVFVIALFALIIFSFAMIESVHSSHILYELFD